MLSHDSHIAAEMSEHLRTQIPKPTVPKYCDSFTTVQCNLLRNSARRCQRFDKDCFLITDMSRDFMQIRFRNQQAVGKRSVMSHDSDNRPFRTVIPQLIPAEFAGAARTIDFPDDSSTGETTGTRNSDKFMPQCSAKTHVPLAELKIGFTDAGVHDINDDFAVPHRPQFRTVREFELIVENDGSHRHYLGIHIVPIDRSKILTADDSILPGSDGKKYDGTLRLRNQRIARIAVEQHS